MRASCDGGTEVVPETWIRNRNALRVIDDDATARRSRQNSKRHRNPMIAARIDSTRERAPRRMYPQTIRQLLGIGADRAKVLHDDGNAVAFLDPQLFGTGDLQLDAGSGSDARQQRKLVDDRADVAAADNRIGKFARPNSQRAHNLAAALGPAYDADVSSNARHHIDESV